MEPHVERSPFDAGSLADRSDDAHVHTFTCLGRKKAHYVGIGELTVVDAELLFSRMKQRHQLYSCIVRADDECIALRNISLAHCIGKEKALRFVDPFAVIGHDAEVTASINVEIRE